MRGEPIWESVKSYNWSGVVIEPNPTQFGQLVQNYAPYPNVSALNTAVSNVEGQVDFWCPTKATTEFCSTNRHFALDAHPDMVVPMMDDHMLVNSTTLSQLWRDINPKKVDLLIIDVTYDEEQIIRQPFPQPLPKLVLFDTSGFRANPLLRSKSGRVGAGSAIHSNGTEVLAELRNLLKAQNYTLVIQQPLNEWDDLWKLEIPIPEPTRAPTSRYMVEDLVR